jgi:hypothetical protein
MKLDEFHIYVHGPFASNIHLDARQLENLKIVISQRPLGVIEYYVLESVSKRRKTKDHLFKELKQQIRMITPTDVSLAVKNLEANGYIRKEQQIPNTQFLKTIEANRVVKGGVVATTKVLKRPVEEVDIGIFSKNLFSITQQGKEKLANSYNNKDYYSEINQYFGVDIDNELTHTSLDKFWKDISAETNIDDYQIVDQLTKEQQREKENYFFGDEDRPVLLAKFALSDFPSEMCLISPNNLKINLKFDKNIIYVYGSGVGLFSSRITVAYNGDTSDISKIRDKLEVSIKKVIQENFKKYGSEAKLKGYYDNIKHERRFKLVDGFNLELTKTSKLAWIHLIYWFRGNEFLECDSRGVSIVNSRMLSDFIDLLEQVPENMSFIRDRLVFYGWGRSLILTKDADESTVKWVQDKVKLVEIGQYSCFGHILIDHLLRRKLSQLILEGSILDVQSSILKKRIEAFDKMRSAIVTYLEEFRSGINTILQSGQTSLVNTLENQWRLEKLRQSIRNKVQSLDSERSSMEQSLLNEKQDRTNKIVLAFTIMGIASVTSAIVPLSPLKDWIATQHHSLSLLTEVFFFIITTLVIISLTVILITKWYDINRWMRSYQEYRKILKDIKGTRKLAPQQALMLLRGISIEAVKDAYNKRKITRSQYKRLIDEISLRIQKISTQEESVRST